LAGHGRRGCYVNVSLLHRDLGDDPGAIVLVAALREISVLFGSLIAMVILKEVMTSWRALASAFVLLGMVLLKMA